MSISVESKLTELLQFAKKNGLMEMVWKDGDVKIAFRRSPEDSQSVLSTSSSQGDDISVSSDTPSAEEPLLVRSPMVGTFRRSVGKGRPPLMMVGNHIKPGDALGVVECMKIPTDVVSYSAGEIKEILVEDGQVVEYGQPLFSVINHV